ncbi:hypothetical protein ABIA31_008938 [Catenulispora sp. MAP5-51]|uniref:hypothetical protein n=1 Tax=Catenulispora sp. MAP5-51 TaxID=3156298 RepID=UPI0035170FFB
MTTPPLTPDSRTDLALILEAAPWALAAMIGTVRDAASAPLDRVLADHPRRTAVLEAAGLVRRVGDSLVVDPVLDVADPATAHSAAAARLSSLRQAVTAAAAEHTTDATDAPGGWLVAGTNPGSEHPLRRAVEAWTADLNGGNRGDTDSVGHALKAAGFGDQRRFPTVPGGPVLLGARRGAGHGG